MSKYFKNFNLLAVVAMMVSGSFLLMSFESKSVRTGAYRYNQPTEQDWDSPVLDQEPSHYSLPISE